MLDLEIRDDVDPVCPHCGTTLRKVYFRELKEFFGRRTIYFCPTCRKTLGFSHRKGFWMG